MRLEMLVCFVLAVGCDEKANAAKVEEAYTRCVARVPQDPFADRRAADGKSRAELDEMHRIHAASVDAQRNCDGMRRECARGYVTILCQQELHTNGR